MHGLHKPMLKLDESGLTFDGAIRLADADRHARITLNRERCVELLFSAYDCGNYGNASLPNGVISTITRAVANWNTGERHLRQEARVAINQIELPATARTSADYLARMAKVQEKFGLCADETTKAITVPAYLNEPRIPMGNPGTGGRWTHGDGIPGLWFVSDPGTKPVLPIKLKYAKDHLTDAEWGAKKMNSTVENVLGLGALESGWGRSRFAKDGRNLFNLYSHAPGAVGSLKAADSDALVAKFPSYKVGMASFVQLAGHYVKNIHDPLMFCVEAQNSNVFGINPKTQKKQPEFVQDCFDTITHIGDAITAERARRGCQ